MPAPVERGTRAVLAAWVMAALAVGATALAAALLTAAATAEIPWKQLLVTAAWSVPGALIAAGRPRVAVGWLMLAVALIFAGSGLAQAWVAYTLAEQRTAGLAWAVWFSDRFSSVLVVCLLVALVLLPDGRLPAPWWRPVLRVVVGLQSVVLAVFLLADGPAAGPDSSFPASLWTLDNPVGVLPQLFGEAVQGYDLWVLQVPLLLVPLAVVTRLRVGPPAERRRLVAILLAVSAFAVLVVVGRALWPAAADAFDISGSVLVAAVLTAAVLRRRLAEVEVVLHHTVVYLTLSALIGGAYVVVTVVAAVWSLSLPPIGAGLTAAALALALLPLRTRLQAAVRRLTYGHRAEPYAAVDRLARGTHTAPTVESVLSELASSLAASLRVPWARATAGDLVAEAITGTPSGEPMTAPLLSGKTGLGAVEVRPGPGRRLTPDDQRLLETLGVHGGIAVHAAMLAELLQASRQRTVVAREVERRRVGRDLHDGLGPTLAGLTMQLGAVRQLVSSDPELAERRLELLESAAQQALADVRRVARELRSPALEQLGLVDALRQSGQALGLDLTVVVDSPPELTAAVETAAYLIATEAMTNVARHTSTRTAELSLRTADGALTLTLVDTGPRAVEGNVEPGVGLLGMHERAEELGGTLSVSPTPGGGTAVVARLPFGSASPAVSAGAS